MNRDLILIALILSFSWSACCAPADSITAAGILSHIRILASDEFEGRAPGTRGEELTVNYLVDQFKKLGLEPGAPDGSFIQKVPMMGLTAQPEIAWRAGGKDLSVAFPADCVVWTKRFVPEVRVENADVLFVGYGVVAPEYGWDDFKGVDVRGKTIIMLVGDPPIPDPKNPSRLDDKMFKGRAMTYYGRWTYKYEIAAEKGAAAAIIVHETGPAGYPWEVIVGSNSRENFDLDSPDKNSGRAAVEGWINVEQAQRICAAAGKGFPDLKQLALKRDFRPVPLDSKVSFKLKVTTREVASRNVIAKVPGNDSKLKNECVIYSAHWDHLGRDPKLTGDQIYNGALDNASGVAGLLELAHAFAESRPSLKRSVFFAAVTGEEKGLLGAKYLVNHPTVPLAQTVANLNMDGINVWGPTRDICVIGLGQNTLEDILKSVAAGRTISGDAEPERGRYFRSDHFEFAKMGVPALYLKSGDNFIKKPSEFGLKVIQDYTTHDYHKVTDEVKPDWDLSGGSEDLKLLYQVGNRIATSAVYPQWKSGSEFKAKRPVR